MQTKEPRHDILTGDLWKVMVALALPIMATNFIQTLYGLADTFFIARLGTEQVASVQLSFPINFLMLSIGTGISVASTAMVARYAGQKDIPSIKRISSQIILVNVVLSIILTVAGIAVLSPTLHMMGIEGSLFDYTHIYLLINFLSLPAIFLMFAYNGIKNGMGDTFSPMVLNSLGVVLTILLDPLFIFTFKLGVAGGALAMLVARTLFTIYAIWCLFGKKGDLELKTASLKPDWEDIRQILNIGLPSCFGSAMEAIGFIVLNMFIMDLGIVTLTAFSIGNRISSLSFMPALGIGAALATVIGQNLGAGNVDRARSAVKSSLIIANLFLIITAIPLIIFATPVTAIFSQDPLVIEQGAWYMTLIMATIPFMAFFNVYTGTFQGSGHTVLSMYMQLGRLWALRIPLILILKSLMPGNPDAIWFSMILSNFFICVYGWMIYRAGKWTVPVIRR